MVGAKPDENIRVIEIKVRRAKGAILKSTRPNIIRPHTTLPLIFSPLH